MEEVETTRTNQSAAQAPFWRAVHKSLLFLFYIYILSLFLYLLRHTQHNFQLRGRSKDNIEGWRIPKNKKTQVERVGICGG